MLVFSILSHAFTGPLTPPVVELSAGYRLARFGAKPDAVVGRNRAPVGKWFDGTKNVPTEYVTWISPGLVARWLGYLARRERWPSTEVQRRWNQYRLATQGHPLFFVALSAYPRQSFVDLTPVAPANRETLSVEQAVIQSVGTSAEAEIRAVGAWQARERGVIERFAWWQVPDWADWAAPKSFSGGDAPRYELGEWFGAWYTLRGEAITPTVGKVVLTSFEKQRVADFSKLSR